MKKCHLLFAAWPVLFLAGCGGGTQPENIAAPAPPPQAPVITSAAPPVATPAAPDTSKAADIPVDNTRAIAEESDRNFRQQQDRAKIESLQQDIRDLQRVINSNRRDLSEPGLRDSSRNALLGDIEKSESEILSKQAEIDDIQTRMAGQR